MSALQSIVFMKTKGWSKSKAKVWLNDHNIHPIKRVHELKNELRYRIREPKFKRYITKKKDGILFVIGFNR